MKSLLIFIFLVIFFLADSHAQNAKDSSLKWGTIDRYSYSLQYPSTWSTDTSKQLGTDLFIFSPKEPDTDKFRENVNVMVQDLKGLNITLDKYIEISEGQIKTLLTDASIIESKRLIQGNKEYHKLIFTGKQGIFKLKSEQYCFLVNEKAFVITLTIEENQYDKYIKNGEAILKSFKLKA